MVVAAIRETGKMVAGAQNLGTGVTDALNALRELTFPEMREEREAKVESTRELLKREHENGPMTVQAIDDGSKKKKQQAKRRK